MARIPFNRPVLFGQETEYILDAIRRAHISGDGYYTKLCHAGWSGLSASRRRSSVPHVPMRWICPHCFSIFGRAMKSSFRHSPLCRSPMRLSFVAPVRSLRISAPIRMNLDESGLEALITERTRAIAVIHYAGVGCEMDAIQDIAAAIRLRLLRIMRTGCSGSIKVVHWEHLAPCHPSFHETKNVSCGEGGALLINQPAYIDRAEILREKGTDRSRLFRGQVEKYTWIDVGSSYLPSDILAAFLFAQFEASQRIQQHRRRIWQFYFDHCGNGRSTTKSDYLKFRSIASNRSTCSTSCCPARRIDRH